MPSEIGVRLGGDNSGFRSMMADSVGVATRSAGQIADGVTGKFTNLKQVGGALATALGINLQEIAEGVARLFTGMSKEEEEAFKKLEQLSDQVAAANLKNMRALLTDEQRYQSDLNERDRLLKRLADNMGLNTAEIVRGKQDELALAERIAAIQEYELKQAEERKKKADEYFKTITDRAEKEYQAQLATLSAEEKIESLKANIAATQAVLASGVLKTADAERMSATLAERKNMLVAEEAKLREEAGKVAEKNSAAERDAQKNKTDATRADLTLEAQRKAIVDEIRKTEKEIAEGKAAGLDVAQQIKRVDELRGQLRDNEKKQNEANVEIARLLLKGAENLTAEEKLRLQILQGQTTQKKIDQEVGELTAKSLAGTLTPAEKERLAVLVGQSDEIRKQLAGMQGLNKEVGMFIKLTRTGQEAQDQTTIALEGALNRAKSQLQQLANDNSYRSVWAPEGKNPLYYTLQMEVQKMENELKMRRNVGNYAGQFGEDAARFKFGDTVTDRALRDMQDATTRTAKDIETIKEHLVVSPMFKKRAR